MDTEEQQEEEGRDDKPSMKKKEELKSERQDQKKECQRSLHRRWHCISLHSSKAKRIPAVPLSPISWDKFLAELLIPINL